ncbi:hypothetical protein LTR37_005363 [Vermiconidia calcicola]|uniref:Uncharacterized protein n=1 Tax=Vermiconidia calcicola TaxID=1690605 RepID=A0ACC3NJB2_9PEZI|nr:hypothetical protein LTR37_005363 [Vermiconidia calcicola]
MTTATTASGLLDLPLELHELNHPIFRSSHVGKTTISLRRCDLQKLLAISRKPQFADEVRAIHIWPTYLHSSFSGLGHSMNCDTADGRELSKIVANLEHKQRFTEQQQFVAAGLDKESLTTAIRRLSGLTTVEIGCMDQHCADNMHSSEYDDLTGQLFYPKQNSGTNGSRWFRALDHAFEATTTALHACRASYIELRAGTTRSHKGLFESLTLQTLEVLLTPVGSGVRCKLRALELSLRITYRDEPFGKSRQIPTAFAFMTNLQSLSLDFRYGSYNRPEVDKIIDFLFEEITLAQLRTLRLRWAICQGETLRGFLLRHADTLKQVALHGHRFSHYLGRGEILNLFHGAELHLEKISLSYIGYEHGFLCDPQEESKPFRECGHVVYDVDATCRLCNAATVADGHPSVVLPKMKERFLNMGYVKWLTEDHLTG